MSNMAAGATIGSNHNSRANDGEIHAGRGFWPGLSVTLKHSSVFASYVLIAMGEYPFELNIKLPFSLVSKNVQYDYLEVMPAYFWMYNIYALERNSWKTQTRDKRKTPRPFIETDYLAPDTTEEIILAISLLDDWIKSSERPFSMLTSDKDDPIPVNEMERYGRKTLVLKPGRARQAYRQMLLFYSLKTLAKYLDAKAEIAYCDFTAEMESGGKSRVSEWVNLGGQLTPAFRLDKLREQIRKGEVNSWDEIHAAYNEMEAFYDLDKARHAWQVYRFLTADCQQAVHPFLDSQVFKKELLTLFELCKMIEDETYKNRSRDFEDPFRSFTFRNKNEMEQVLGTAKDSHFIKIIKQKTVLWQQIIENLSKRL
jgi:hypothetical protein